MQEAIKMAKKAFKLNEVPIGAIIIDQNGKIISKAYNLVQKKQNPLYHAEIIAINKACKKLKTKSLKNCSMYVTLEPCYMCASAIMGAKISKLYIGAEDTKFGSIISGLELYKNANFNHKIDLYIDIMKEECSALLNVFFEKRR